MKKDAFVIGVDYGTDSVRSVVVNAHSGQEIASAVFHYPRWSEQKYCDPSLNRFRQHPLDYIDGLEQSILQCLTVAGKEVAAQIKAISVDTTGSTPVAIDKSGTPLALLPQFAENPNAMFVLWKDHTAVKEAAQINEHAASYGGNYLRFVGGIYSSEWFWAKILHILREDQAVANACYSFVEHCDWIPFLLTGGKKALDLKRGICAAGHKALWAEAFGGFPPDEFFSSLDPLLEGFTASLGSTVYSADKAAGKISTEWAQRLGLSPETIIGIGAFDAHMGAVGGQIEPYHLSKVMGTSTCDMLVIPMNEAGNVMVKGICGQVPGSVIPGMLGLEAGQSAFGDFYAWFRDILSWPLKQLLSSSAYIDPATAEKIIKETIDKIIPELSTQAALLPPDETDVIAIDWINGRRTPDANQRLTGSLLGLNLGADAPRLFKAIVESTCFGAKAIVDRFNAEGVPVKGLIGLGGIAGKSPFIMQMMADIMNMPIRIHRSSQTCALGAAMFAATAAGIYNKVEEAMNAMGPGFAAEYHPDNASVGIYAKRYDRYLQTGRLLEKQIS